MAGKKSNGSPGEFHGLTKTREYRIWARMCFRCRNKNSSDWKHYGGRGINVCERWANSFLLFLADMGECPKNHSIDRINGLKGYEKSNCRWATRAQQARNTSRTKLIEYRGKTQCLTDWANELGLRFGALLFRMKKGMSFREAISYDSSRGNGRYFTFKGETMNISQWSRKMGIKYVTLHQRLSAGWTIEKALKTSVG